MSNLMNLTARQHTSTALATWIAGREGAAQRAGMQDVQAAGENMVSTNIGYQELINVLGAAGMSSSGQAVTPDSAMRVSAVCGDALFR